MPSYPSLNFPNYDFRIKEVEDKQFIFDVVRKKYIRLLPEEWVRQHVLHFLMYDRKYPKTLLAVEKGFYVNGQSRRSDVVAFNKLGKPYLIVECKSFNIKINQKTFDQIARYNMLLQVDYLVVTNGFQHYCCAINYETNSYQYVADIPFYAPIST